MLAYANVSIRSSSSFSFFVYKAIRAAVYNLQVNEIQSYVFIFFFISCLIHTSFVVTGSRPLYPRTVLSDSIRGLLGRAHAPPPCSAASSPSPPWNQSTVSLVVLKSLHLRWTTNPPLPCSVVNGIESHHRDRGGEDNNGDLCPFWTSGPSTFRYLLFDPKTINCAERSTRVNPKAFDCAIKPKGISWICSVGPWPLDGPQIDPKLCKLQQ